MKACCASDQESACFGLGVGMGEACADLDEVAELIEVMAKKPKDRGAHGRAVARRVYAAACGRESEPEFEDGAQGGKAHACGQAKQPPTQTPRKRVSKAFGVALGCKPRLRGHAMMFGVIADHPVSSEQTVFEGAATKQAGGALGGDTFSGKAHRITKRKTPQATEDLLLRGWGGWSMRVGVVVCR